MPLVSLLLLQLLPMPLLPLIQFGLRIARVLRVLKSHIQLRDLHIQLSQCEAQDFSLFFQFMSLPSMSQRRSQIRSNRGRPLMDGVRRPIVRPELLVVRAVDLTAAHGWGSTPARSCASARPSGGAPTCSACVGGDPAPLPRLVRSAASRTCRARPCNALFQLAAKAAGILRTAATCQALPRASQPELVGRALCAGPPV